MTKHVVLISSDQVDINLALLHYDDIYLSIITKPKYSSLYEPKFRVFPVSDVANLMELKSAISEIQKYQPIDAIISGIERGIIGSGFIRSFFNIQGTDFQTSLKFSNKLIMKQALVSSGLNIAPFSQVYNLEDILKFSQEHGWPVVLKPAIGSGSVGIKIIFSEQHLTELITQQKLNNLFDSNVILMCEKYIRNDFECHYDGIVEDNTTIFGSASRYFVSPADSNDSSETYFNGSYTLDDDSPIRSVIEKIHDKVITTLGLRNGVTHLELLHTDSGFYVGEIACRCGGGGIPNIIRNKYNVNLMQAYIDGNMSNKPSVIIDNRPGVFGMLGLPVKSGIVDSFSPDNLFEDHEEIIEIKRFYNVGDRIDCKQTSVSFFAMLFFCVNDEKSARKFKDKIAKKFILKMRDV